MYVSIALYIQLRIAYMLMCIPSASSLICTTHFHIVPARIKYVQICNNKGHSAKIPTPVLAVSVLSSFLK